MSYNYTKPRQPVAACFNSPGPVYSLPSLTGYLNHDPQSIYMKRPAYTFGHRGPASSSAITPGPYDYDQQIAMRTLYSSVPKYTLCGRQKSSHAVNAGVPAAYRGMEPDYIFSKRSPAYSMGKRHPTQKFENVPAPNQYQTIHHRPVESKHRRAPCYAISSRIKNGGFDEDLHRTPGPGRYTITDQTRYLPSPPNYTFAPRRAVTTGEGSKPGPGAYRSEIVNVTRRQAPKFSFGMRHSAYAVPYIVLVK